MMASLRKLNHFLLQQALYPLILSSLLAVGIFLARVLYSHSTVHANLVWNLFLAWIPYLSSLTAAGLDRLFPRAWWLLPLPGLVWLVFLPNAPYIVTDFYHLDPYPPVPLWYDIGLLASFAFSGYFLAVASLRAIQELVEKYLGKVISWSFVVFSLGLCGLGIYLGRFNRWNSWDFLVHPKAILKDIALPLLNPFDHLRFFGFTLMFTALLAVFYLMFVSFIRRSEPEPKR